MQELSRNVGDWLGMYACPNCGFPDVHIPRLGVCPSCGNRTSIPDDYKHTSGRYVEIYEGVRPTWNPRTWCKQAYYRRQIELKDGSIFELDRYAEPDGCT
jgi:hypothetical protein